MNDTKMVFGYVNHSFTIKFYYMPMVFVVYYTTGSQVAWNNEDKYVQIFEAKSNTKLNEYKSLKDQFSVFCYSYFI